MRAGIAQGPLGHLTPVACAAPNSIILFLLEATACIINEFLASVIDMCKGYSAEAALETLLKAGVNGKWVTPVSSTALFVTVCHSMLRFSPSPKSNQY